MARQPDGDERVLLPKCEAERGERVYLRDLAKVLHERPAKLARFARHLHLLHHVSIGGMRDREKYVTPYGAMRVIAHFRIIQGGMYHEGISIHEVRERQRTYLKLHRARLVETRNTEQRISANQASLALAIPSAETEDEGTEERSAGGDVKPEAVAGNPGGVRT